MSYWTQREEYKSAHIAWSTRAIWRDGYIDIVASHNQYKGPKKGRIRKAFFQALTAADKDLREKARDLRWTKLLPDVAEHATLFEDDTIKVVATTNQSHGYLYLAAFYK